MCGIAGILDEKHVLENQQVIFEAMIHSMKHRGSINQGIFLEKHVALFHVLQSYKHDIQPMKINEFVIVYNGECTNTEQLKKMLIKKGFLFKTQSDTEVILTSYIAYKEKCLPLIKGIFSFAIYNSITSELFLARDPIGVKPLFYTFIDQALIFASEIKTLLTHPLIIPTIDDHSIHQLAYLGPGRISGNGVFKNIHEIKPGEYGIYSNNSLQLHTYYEIPAIKHTESFENTKNHLRDLVTRVIESQLCSDSLGVLLSGGLDSSIICAVASNYFKKKNQTLNTFSLEFENDDTYFIPTHFQPSQDKKYIELMVDTFKTNHTVITLKHSDLINSLYQAVDARDLPGMGDIDSSLYCFCKQLKKYVDVVISGECADEIFGGYPWFFDDNSSYFPWTQNLEFRNSLLLEKYQLDPYTYTQNLYQNTMSNAPISTPQDVASQQMTYLNIHWFMQTLLDRKDRMCMANGLEARVPFCDIDLLEYVYSIPWTFKSYHNKEKGILREAMKELLPEEIVNRKKSPFPKTHHPEYLKLLRNELSKLDNEPIWNIFNKVEVMKLLHEESPIPWYGQLMMTPQTIAYFLQLNYWLKKYKIQIINSEQSS